MADTESEYELEAVEPSKPRPPAPPGGYLPRLTYKPPEPDPDDPDGETKAEGEPAAKGKKTQGAAPVPKKTGSAPVPRGREPGLEAKPKGSSPAPVKKARPRAERVGESPNKVLKEDTPEFDTYEARKRVRMVVGGIAALFLLFAGFRIFRALFPPSEPPFEDMPPEAMAMVPETQPPRKQASQREAQAKALLEEARQYAGKGKTELALARLELLKTSFKDSNAAREAEAALARLEDGFPLFPDGPIIQASAAQTASDAEVSAEEARALALVGPSEAEIQAPPSTPEPVEGVGDPESARRLLPEGFHARPGPGMHESGWPREIACDRDHSTLVLVPGGTYRLGNDKGSLAERPEHSVTLSTFYIDRHEVTNRQMQTFREATGTGSSEPQEGAPELPSVNASLSDALAYAEWAGKAVPSEAQWEAAARSFDGRLYPWGKGKAEWSHPREPRQIDPVMTYPRDVSPVGAFDLSGNAWEWTQDIFSTSYYETLKKEPAVDPSGPERSHSRIVEYTVKGGSSDWDVAWRSGMRPEAKLPYVGFRCILKVDQAPTPAPIPQNPGTQPVGSPRDNPAAPVPF